MAFRQRKGAIQRRCELGYVLWQALSAIFDFRREDAILLERRLVEALLGAREERLLAKILRTVLWLLVARGVDKPQLSVHLHHRGVVRRCVPFPKHLKHLRIKLHIPECATLQIRRLLRLLELLLVLLLLLLLLLHLLLS